MRLQGSLISPTNAVEGKALMGLMWQQSTWKVYPHT